MHLDLNIGYMGADLSRTVPLVAEAERLGYRCVWAAEAYGPDAATVLGALAATTERIGVGSAIFQIPARTPAMTAMTAATLDDLSGGRFRLGLGVSGPQVVEGWHGVAYGKPLRRTREYVAIVRQILEREEPVAYAGDDHRIPYAGPDATGLGKPLKLIGRAHGDLPIYLAAIGLRNVSLAAEIADGWLPAFYSPERGVATFADALEAGFGRSGEPEKASRFDIVASVQAVVTSDLDAARQVVRPQLALYLGGMGAKHVNFYNQLAVRYGYEAAADEVQRRYLSGDRAGAMRAIPDALIDEVALVGPVERIRDRLAAWHESAVTSLAVSVPDVHSLRGVVEALG